MGKCLSQAFWHSFLTLFLETKRTLFLFCLIPRKTKAIFAKYFVFDFQKKVFVEEQKTYFRGYCKDIFVISGISASLSSTLGIPHPPPPSLAGLGLGHHGIPPHILAAQRVGMLPGKSASTDYTRYFKRFGSSMECGSYYCKDMNYREHFHCTVLMCKDKVL